MPYAAMAAVMDPMTKHIGNYLDTNMPTTNHKRPRSDSNMSSIPFDCNSALLMEGAMPEASIFTSNIHVNPSAGRNGCNLALAHGKNWTERWKDNRPLLNRIFMPSLYFNEGLAQPVIASGGGVQGVSDYNLYDAPNLHRYLVAVEALSTDSVLPKPFFNEASAPNNSSVISSSATNKKDDFNNIIIPLAENRHTFMNDTNVHSELLIYEYVCKVPCSWDRDRPQVLWDAAYRELNEGCNALTLNAVLVNTLAADTVSNVDKTVIGERPHGRALHTYWKQLSFTRLNMPPGKTVQWVTHAIRHKVCYNDLRNWLEMGALNSLDCVPGWTKALLFIIRGQIVAVKSAATLQTYSSANVRHEFETQTAAFQPYRHQQKKCIGKLTTNNPGAGPGIWNEATVANQVLYNNLTDTSGGYSIIS